MGGRKSTRREKEKRKEKKKGRVCVALSMAADEDYIIKDEVSSQSTSSGEQEATYYGQ